jgi:hypothetical protein
MSFYTIIEENKKQQLMLSSRFRTADGVALEAYLIEN